MDLIRERVRITGGIRRGGWRMRGGGGIDLNTSNILW